MTIEYAIRSILFSVLYLEGYISTVTSESCCNLVLEAATSVVQGGWGLFRRKLSQSNQAILVSGRLPERLGEADKYLMVIRKIPPGTLRRSKVV